MNCDGEIDIYDCVLLAQVVGSSGTPINTTELLLELQGKVDSLNATVIFLEEQLAEMNTTLVELQTELIILNATGLKKPEFDSDWLPMSTGENTIFFDNPLNTTNVFVYIVGKKTEDGDPHQIDYGGYVNVANYNGVYWHELTLTYIKVNRHGNDQNWNYIRVMIWKIQES